MKETDFEQDPPMYDPNLKFLHFQIIRLYTETRSSVIHRKKEKLKCIFNYFRRITARPPTGTLSFERRFLRDEDLPAWSQSQKPLRGLTVCADGVIEKCQNSLQVDFADKIIGGFILDFGLVQEKIRFAFNPELIVSRIFNENMTDNEVVLMTGSEQFNEYTGYGDSFRWAGDHEDVTSIDEFGRRSTQIVAMDATSFGRSQHLRQFLRTDFERELKKAYIAFIDRREQYHKLIATGNWGCGVFKGDPQFKLLIQLLAAAQADKDIKYFTFHDRKLKKEFDDFYGKLIKRKIRVGQLYEYLVAYGEYVKALDGRKEVSVFNFIEKNHLLK